VPRGHPIHIRLGLTALRAALGAVFIAHGTQKLFGWFNGPGPDALGHGFDAMGLRPGKRNAIIAGVSETAGLRLVERLAPELEPAEPTHQRFVRDEAQQPTTAP
jgi:hypothetical protein